MQNKEQYQNYIRVFLAQNSILNLISKNDEKYLWEKHIFDSLNINLFFEKYGTPKTMLDIGTGGGFPSVPVAITYPSIEIYALDSIAKKVNAVENMKQELNLKNLHTICARVETLDKKYDLVVSRAVASLDKLIIYAEKCVCEGGYFVAFKSRLLEEELATAQKVLKHSKLKLIDTLEYELPTEEKHIRKLVVFKNA